MNVFSFAWTALKRDWRAGELRLVALGLLIAVTSVSAVAFFVDRVRSAMEIQANTLLAADLAIESSYVLPEALVEEASARGLKVSRVLFFRSVLEVGDDLQLAEVKAVDGYYPLRGQLEVAGQPFEVAVATRSVPAPGTAWADARLFQVLGIAPGAAIDIGKSRLTLTKVIAFEPDRGGDLFSIAPRLLMNQEDVPATGLILPGSRVTYRLLLAGEAEAIESYRAWIKGKFEEDVRVINVREARPELRSAMERAEKFLSLAALSSVLLAGIAIASAAKRYAARHLDTSAVMRCLGATQGFIARAFTLEILALGVAVSLLGCLLGFAGHMALVHYLADLTVGNLPPPTWTPVAVSVSTGIITLLGFAMPPLLGLKHVPPARVLRRDLGPAPRFTTSLYPAAVLVITLLTAWHAREIKLTGYVLGGTVATLAILAAVAWGMVKGLGLLRGRVGVAWRYGFANVARRARASVTQVVALGLGIMVMLLLGLVRSGLLAGWGKSLPENAPNQFIINIQPGEVEVIRKFLADRGFTAQKFFPMVRGRLITINGKPVNPNDYQEPRARRLADRDFNLSWATELQADNRIAQGEWWGAKVKAIQQFSVETELAETLRIKRGDELSFRVADQTITAKTTSLREVDWDTFNVNFFVISPPGLLDKQPSTFITSLHLPPKDKRLLTELIARFPSLTVIDVAALLGHVRGIMEKASVALKFVFLFTLAAGGLVLIAAIQSTHDERLHESAVLRTLGANSRNVAQGLLAEFLALGTLAGLLAALSAIGVGYALAEFVFHVPYHFNPWLIPLGLVIGAVGVGLVGLLGTRPVLRTPPAEVLRKV
jgi:putative ABC transport system permease protein